MPSRWRKGTLDHDGDGKMGGSNPKESAMTAKKTETKTDTEEHGIDAKGKVNKNLDADGKDIAAQDGRAARLATMTPDGDAKAAGQVETTSGR